MQSNQHILEVSIGIPAFNEEKNIQTLIRAILLQKTSKWILKEIIIVSDGSTDNTVRDIARLQNTKIRVIAERERLGKSKRINQIIQMFQGDILFLIDADILIQDNTILSQIIEDTQFDKAGIVSVNTMPIRATNLFERFLNYSLEMQIDIRKNWNNGINYLAFRGCFLGFSGNFIRSVQLDQSLINNDSYLFFLAIENGYKPKHFPSIAVYYKTPSTFTEHITQSSRFQIAKDEIKRYITIDIDKYFIIPKYLTYKAAVKFFITNPLYFFGYLMVYVATRMKRQKDIPTQWSIAATTKEIAL